MIAALIRTTTARQWAGDIAALIAVTFAGAAILHAATIAAMLIGG